MPALTMRILETQGRQRTPLAAIPQDVKDTLEEALAEAPGARLETGPFALDGETVVVAEEGKGTKEAAESWLVHARSYAQLRPETAGGKFTFAGNAVKNGCARWIATPR